MPYLRPTEVVKGQAGSVEIIAEQDVTSATAEFEKLTGDAVATLTATVDSYTATISSVTDDAAVVSSSSAALIAGDPLLHIPASGVDSRLWIKTYTSPTAITFETPPVNSFAIGDTIKGCKISATIPSTATGTLGVNYRIRWVITYADETVRSYDQRIYVVRSGFPPTPSITDTGRFVAANFPSEYELQGGEKLRRIAYAAQDKLRNELLGQGRYAHLTGADSSTFAEAGLLALQSVLLMEGFFHSDTDRVAYSDSLNKRFFGSVMTGLRSLTHYDTDADGNLSENERRRWGGIPAVRT